MTSTMRFTDKVTQVQFTEQAVVQPSKTKTKTKTKALRGRRLVIVDIENVTGGAVLTIDQASWARQRIEETVHLDGTEHIVIGTSHAGLLAAGLGWRGPRLVVRSGKNGADLALLQVLTDEHVEDRFDEVVVVSGDGIFADVVASLGATGVCVTVVSRPRSLSNRLRMAAKRSLPINEAVDDLGGVG